MAKTSKPTKRRQPRQARPPTRTAGRRLAVSSGQAARYCLVSSDTIANWIVAGRLPAQRTAGGQYRIRLSDLRTFMRAHGMKTDLLDEELGHSCSCWEFWAGERQACPPATCHEVRPLLPGGTLRALSCAECDFMAGLEPGDARS